MQKCIVICLLKSQVKARSCYTLAQNFAIALTIWPLKAPDDLSPSLLHYFSDTKPHHFFPLITHSKGSHHGLTAISDMLGIRFVLVLPKILTFYTSPPLGHLLSEDFPNHTPFSKDDSYPQSGSHYPTVCPTLFFCNILCILFMCLLSVYL